MTLFLALKVSIWLVLLQDPNAPAGAQLSREEAIMLYDEVANRLVEIGLTPRLSRIRVLKDFSPAAIRDAQDAEFRLYDLISWAGNKRGYLRRNRLIHFLTPRTLDGYMVGFSSGACTYKMRDSFTFKNLRTGKLFTRGGAVSYSTAQLANSLGQGRFQHSIVGALHEIGHDIGAEHVLSNTVMNPAAYAVFDEIGPLAWDQTSLSEIYQCLAPS